MSKIDVNKIYKEADNYIEKFKIKYPSAKYIAEKLGYSQPTVIKYLKKGGYEVTRANYGARNGAKKGSESHLYGKKQSEETQEKKREKLKGKKRPKEIFEKIIKTRIENGNLVPSFSNVRYYKDLNMIFRSSWEANYARYLNQIGLSWEYESKTFILKDDCNNFIGSYTPDFYIKDSDYYVEIKGFFSDENKAKMNLFRSQYPTVDVRIIFKDDYDKISKEFGGKITNWGEVGELIEKTSNNGVKLDVEKVKEIKKMLASGCKNIEIARRFNISESLVSSIKNNRTWKYVEAEVCDNE